MEMLSVRCKSPHPRLVGKPCNAMMKVKASEGQFSVGCPRCYGWLDFDFDETGTEDSSRQNEQIAIGLA